MSTRTYSLCSRSSTSPGLWRTGPPLASGTPRGWRPRRPCLVSSSSCPPCWGSLCTRRRCSGACLLRCGWVGGWVCWGHVSVVGCVFVCVLVVGPDSRV